MLMQGYPEKEEPGERFVKISHSIFEELSQTAQRRKCPLVLVVYLALLYHCDARGWCFPSYRRLMELSGIRGKATLAKTLQILREEGFLTVSSSHGRHGNNRYFLSSISELKGSIIERLKFNFRTLKVQNLNAKSSKFEHELYPFNYIHSTIPNELNIRREKNFPSPKERFFSYDYYQEWEKERC